MSNSNTRKVLEIYEIMKVNYPGFLSREDDLVYFTDRSISPAPINTGFTFKETDKLICVTLFGQGLALTLSCDLGIEFEYTRFTNSFKMDIDHEMSDGACMSLYKHDIQISYFGGNDQNEEIFYDRTSIERKYTIGNIIKDEV